MRYESSGTRLFAVLGALAAGATLMYFLDPENGRRRRAFVRNQVLHDTLDDSMLVERVRAAMGRVISDPLAIDVRAHDGCVMLKGPAQPEQIGELVACAERVRGVRAVDNRLSVSNPP
jgi:osmotically-inducible protein OsmY